MKKNVAKWKETEIIRATIKTVILKIYIYYCFYSCSNFIVALNNNPALSYRISGLPFVKNMNKKIPKLQLKK